MDEEVSPDEPLPTRTESEGATVDRSEGLVFFPVDQVLGDRYEMLGRGGMVEIRRAFDLELRVEVGLKALREELIAKLKTLTNLRVVRNPMSGTGWTLTHDPFSGWETVPSW